MAPKKLQFSQQSPPQRSKGPQNLGEEEIVPRERSAAFQKTLQDTRELDRGMLGSDCSGMHFSCQSQDRGASAQVLPRWSSCCQSGALKHRTKGCLPEQKASSETDEPGQPTRRTGSPWTPSTLVGHISTHIQKETTKLPLLPQCAKWGNASLSLHKLCLSKYSSRKKKGGGGWAK